MQPDDGKIGFNRKRAQRFWSKSKWKQNGTCLFYRKDNPPIEIIINNVMVNSMKSMNVPGVQYDSKLNWSVHISKQINKANRALHADNMIKNYFSQPEICIPYFTITRKFGTCLRSNLG